jgi:hypothetical protein
MSRIALSKTWTRAVAGVGLVLTLHAAQPARADGSARPPRTAGQTRPLPAPGTHRLIRIGPQALVIEDDHGRVSMVEEPGPKARRGRGLAAVPAAFGLLSFGTFLILDNGNGLNGNGPGFDFPRAPGVR